MEILFQTPVEQPKQKVRLCHSDRIMLFGSCFAGHIGTLLNDAKFRCDTNPYGVLYNPISIAEALKQIQRGESYTELSPELIEHQGWHSLMHHSQFSAERKEECLEKINQRLQAAVQNWNKTNILILTFGSAYVYRYKENGNIVGNCHKIPESRFLRELLSVQEITDAYTELIRNSLSTHPTLQIIFTISPIRHRKDGMHGNQISKATLMLAVEQLVARFPKHCCYFPAYEIMMDELRDYRFYADDMLHPTPLAVNYIWERFKKWSFDTSTNRLLEEWNEIQKALNHRPTNPESEAHKEFLTQLVLRIERLCKKYPNFDAQKELETCRILLTK